MMIIPPFLKEGDTVRVVAPARKVNAEEIEPQLQILKDWGLKIKYSPSFYSEYHQFAGTDEVRAADFNDALHDNEAKAILCARGGYGAVRIVDTIDFSVLLKNPKWIIGFSDITVFHNEINNLGLASLHGPMPLIFPKIDSICMRYLKKTLFGDNFEIIIPNNPNNITGKVQGVLTGGNLSILVSMIGTKSDIDTKDKILFIEDLDEYYYHIDRMLHQMKRAGKLQNLKALVVGSMSEMKDNAVPFGISTYQMILNLVKEYNYPVIFDFPTGHESMNHSLILGGTYELTVGDRCSLKFLGK
ncbi:MAG: LD-carboxypeptidase [Cytophagales bacterium]